MPNVVPRSYAEMQRLFAAECRRLAEEAHFRYRRNINSLLYLSGTKAVGLDTLNPWASVWEQLTIATEEEIDCRPELQLIRGEHVPRNQTIDHLENTMREWLSREPLWCFAD